MEPEKTAEIIEFPRGTTPEPETKPAPLRDVIGRVLRSHRQEQKRTLSDVAQEAAMSTQYLSEVERGRKEVSSELLATISGAVGLRMVELSRLNTSYARSPPATLSTTVGIVYCPMTTAPPSRARGAHRAARPQRDRRSRIDGLAPP